MTQKAASAKVWVTGANGMLGRMLVRLLKARDVVTIETGRELDICQRTQLEAFCDTKRPTHLINCAAMTAVDLCESQMGLAQKVNGEGPETLGEVARRFDLIAAHVSTDYVFAGEGTKPWREDALCAPKSAYGKTKLEGERGFLRATHDEGFVVRTSWLFGPFGQNFVSTMLKLMAERDELRVVNDQRGRPTATQDLAEALMGLVGLDVREDGGKKPSSGIYHFANDGEVSWFEFAEQILREARAQRLSLKCSHVLPTTSAEFRREAPRPAYSSLDTKKVSRALGRTPRPYVEPLHEYVAGHAKLV